MFSAQNLIFVQTEAGRRKKEGIKKRCWEDKNRITSNAGLQYRHGQVGRDVNPPSHPHLRNISNARLTLFDSCVNCNRPMDGQMHEPTNGPTDQRTSEQTKSLTESLVRDLEEEKRAKKHYPPPLPSFSYSGFSLFSPPVLFFVASLFTFTV